METPTLCHKWGNKIGGLVVFDIYNKYNSPEKHS